MYSTIYCTLCICCRKYFFKCVHRFWKLTRIINKCRHSSHIPPPPAWTLGMRFSDAKISNVWSVTHLKARVEVYNTKAIFLSTSLFYTHKNMHVIVSIALLYHDPSSHWTTKENKENEQTWNGNARAADDYWASTRQSARLAPSEKPGRIWSHDS